MKCNSRHIELGVLLSVHLLSSHILTRRERVGRLRIESGWNLSLRATGEEEDEEEEDGDQGRTFTVLSDFFPPFLLDVFQ